LLLWPYLHRPAALPADSIAVLLDGAGARGVLPTARAVGRLRPGDGLGQLRCPVMAIGADHDAISPLPDLAAFAQAVPAAQTVVLEGTGHMVMLERPDAFNTEVTSFLDRLVQHEWEETGMHLRYLWAKHPEIAGGSVHHVQAVSSRAAPSPPSRR
jgi:hypothetical protein